MGWDENLFTEGSIPTIEELDYVAPHCPIYLKRVCYHAFLVNSMALEMIHYHPSIEVPKGRKCSYRSTNQKTDRNVVRVRFPISHETYSRKNI